jgi:signal transduction histidine kinase
MAVSAHEARRWRLDAPERCDAFVSSRRGRSADGHARWQCWPSRTVSLAPSSLAAVEETPASAVLGATLREGPWTGQVLVLDPAPNQRRLSRAKFLHDALQHAGPAFYRTYLARQLRQQAGAIERARVARELHDGVIQTLTGLDLQVEAVRRRAAEASPAVGPALERIQAVLRDEVLNLRDLMQHLRHTDVDPRHVVDHMSDMVERFHRDTGITATFFSDLPDPQVPSEISRELLRVLQEALINVRKHSGAHTVVVRLSTSDETWTLFVSDDGRGFPFEGRLTLDELDERRTGPLVLKERVRALGGTLCIASQPGAGASLDIVIPREAHVA